MTTRNPIIKRQRPPVDETIYEQRLTTYLARQHHPTIAHILAYEDATHTGPGRRDKPITPEWTTAA